MPRERREVRAPAGLPLRPSGSATCLSPPEPRGPAARPLALLFGPGHVQHAQLVQDPVQQPFFLGRQVASALDAQQIEHVDLKARLLEVQGGLSGRGVRDLAEKEERGLRHGVDQHGEVDSLGFVQRTSLEASGGIPPRLGRSLLDARCLLTAVLGMVLDLRPELTAGGEVTPIRDLELFPGLFLSPLPSTVGIRHHRLLEPREPARRVDGVMVPSRFSADPHVVPERTPREEPDRGQHMWFAPGQVKEAASPWNTPPVSTTWSPSWTGSAIPADVPGTASRRTGPSGGISSRSATRRSMPSTRWTPRASRRSSATSSSRSSSSP